MIDNLAPDLRRTLALVLTDDPGAAAEVRTLARRLTALADQLEARAADRLRADPYKSPGGLGDRVKIAVTNPAGFTITRDTEPPEDYTDSIQETNS